jgi:hypothetical protein
MYADVATRMRTELRRQQLLYHDAGLLPESEMMKRAAQNNLTIHEMVRDPKLYDLPALLDAADLALEQREKNLPRLQQMLDSPDSGIRYWGAVGCFLLDYGDVAAKGMTDESDEVRAMAAWLAVRTDNREAGMACFQSLLKEDSPALLTVLNIIDWMGPDGAELVPLVTALNPHDNKYQMRMVEYLAGKD